MLFQVMRSKLKILVTSLLYNSMAISIKVTNEVFFQYLFDKMALFAFIAKIKGVVSKKSLSEKHLFPEKCAVSLKLGYGY